MFRLSWQANADLQAIADYLGVKSPVAAAQVLDALLATFEFLAKNPRLGEPRDDLHPGIRMFVPDSPADSYVIFYYPLPSGIEISDCIHAARDWVGMFVRGYTVANRDRASSRDSKRSSGGSILFWRNLDTKFA